MGDGGSGDLDLVMVSVHGRPLGVRPLAVVQLVVPELLASVFDFYHGRERRCGGLGVGGLGSGGGGGGADSDELEVLRRCWRDGDDLLEVLELLKRGGRR